MEKHSYRLICFCWTIIWLFLVMLTPIGCSTAQLDDLENESSISDTDVTLITTSVDIPSSSTPALSWTSTPTVTILPSATSTAKAMVTPSPANTLTAPIIPLPTLTPLPTIPLEQRGQTFTQLLRDNGGCVLPCWWGFELGKSSMDEVRQIYTSFDTYIAEQFDQTGISVLEAKFVDPQIENGVQVNHTFIAQDNVVIEALIDIHDPNYQIGSLLQRLGQPSEIWMWTIPESYQGILPSRFRLYFPEHGVFVLYATGGQKIVDHVNICFDEPGGATLLLWNPDIWDPEGTKDIYDRSNEGGSAFTLEGFPIEEVSNWDVEQFYTILTDPDRSECLETPSNLWPHP